MAQIHTMGQGRFYDGKMTPPRRFLFLQGVCSPFFNRLGLMLRSRGHYVRKVNFTAGDWVYWRQGETIGFRGPMLALGDFYAHQFRDGGITDIVLFGDCRPVHRPAIALAQSAGIRVHVFEEGYFRPYWITVERDGVNGNSRLPRDPAWYRNEAKAIPHFDNGVPFHSPFWKRAAYDVGYNFWAGLNPLLYPGVCSHVPHSPLTEYVGYIRRGLRIKYRDYTSHRVEARLIEQAEARPFYLVPLQLTTDSQIRFHSPFESMAQALRQTMESFASAAPTHARLAAKIHPLDPGLVDYRALIHRWATDMGIKDRVFYLESGNLPSLLSNTAGVVTVNSTVGPSALIHSKPTIVLGTAIYNMPGLTFQGTLDNFWTQGEAPDRTLTLNFRDVVIHKTQVNGGYYSGAGIALAIQNCLAKLESDYI